MIKKNYILIIVSFIGSIFHCCNQSVNTSLQNNDLLIKSGSLDFYNNPHLSDTSCSAFVRIITKISCDEAKVIAKEAGYWLQKDSFQYGKISLLDSGSRKLWLMEYFDIHFRKGNDSKIGNGFKDITQKKLVINATTGHILFKSEQKKTYPMNSFIKITGTKEQLLNFPSAGYLEIRVRSANQLEENLWEVRAYADEVAITALRDSHYTVTIIMTAEEIYAEQLKMAEDIEKNKNK